MSAVDLDRINQTLRSKYHCLVFYDNPPETAFCALEKGLSLSVQEINDALEWGSLYLNGKRLVSDQVLAAPLKLEYYQSKIPYKDLAQAFPKFNSDWIIYQDDYLAICFKPPGISSAPAKEQQKYSMYNYLCSYHSCDVHLPSRLDFSTSGIMMYSLSKETHSDIQKIYSNREVEKRYLLKVDSKITWQDKVVDANIGRDYRHPVLRKIKSEGGKSAKTIFTNKSEEFGSDILEAKPVTGRTHQIRVHVAEGLGYPIMGDNFYAGAIAEDLCLLSYSLEFKHPITQEILTIKCPNELLPAWLRTTSPLF